MEYFKKIFLILLSFIILFIIYSSFSTNNHLSYGQDALLYSYWKDNGLIAGTGRNLLWSVSFFYFYKIFNFLALSGGALRAGQILSSLFSAGNVILFYFILEKFFINKKDYLLGIVFTCFYAFSFSHWHLSGEVTYAAFTSFFILILLLLIIRTDKDISLKKAFLFGILFAVVPLSRYPSFILLPVFGAIVYFSAKKLPGLKLVLSCIVSIIIFYILYLCLSNILGHGPQFIIETHKYIFQILAKKSGIGVKLTLDKIPIGIL